MYLPFLPYDIGSMIVVSWDAMVAFSHHAASRIPGSASFSLPFWVKLFPPRIMPIFLETLGFVQSQSIDFIGLATVSTRLSVCFAWGPFNPVLVYAWATYLCIYVLRMF